MTMTVTYGQPWWGGWIYRIVNGVTSDVGVPSTYLVWIYDTWDVITNSIDSFNFIIIGKLTELQLLYPPYPKDRGMLWFYVEAVLTWFTFQGRRSKVKVTASENDVIFSTFLNFHFLSHFPPKPSWGGHSNTPSNSAPLPLFCPSVCPSVCPSIGLLTTFSGFCTFADKSLGRNGIELEMQMFPDDLPLANIDADGYCCHFMRSSVRPTIHGLGFVYCIQSAWKKWPTIWHADVSRWLTLSIHGCLWILLLVCLSVHLSVCSFTAFSGGCAFG